MAPKKKAAAEPKGLKISGCNKLGYSQLDHSMAHHPTRHGQVNTCSTVLYQFITTHDWRILEGSPLKKAKKNASWEWKEGGAAEADGDRHSHFRSYYVLLTQLCVWPCLAVSFCTCDLCTGNFI